MASSILLPGEAIAASSLPTSPKRRLGFGVHHDASTDTFTSTIAGTLEVNHKKRSAQIGAPYARYIPQAGDLVIAQVHHSSAEYFHLYLAPHTPQAILPQFAFEGATKKTKPQLKPNDIVYAKVVSAQRNTEVELTCVNPSTGKSEPDGLGPLNGGMVFDISTGLAARLLRKEGVVVLEELGEKLQGGFEVAVGKNGRIWVECPGGGVRGVCAIGKCLKETDEGRLQEKEQRKLVARVANEIGFG